MISFVKGTLDEVMENAVVVEAAGIGYEIHVSSVLIGKLPPVGQTVKIYTYLQVKEDGVALFGFADRQELQMFHRLIGVSSVGPKYALAILSVLTSQEVAMAVISGDVKAITAAPGVGTKTAQRIILELKDKLRSEDAVFAQAPAGWIPQEERGQGGAIWEAIDAMTALGYSRSEAAKAVKAVAQEDMDAEAILKAALKKMVSF